MAAVALALSQLDLANVVPEARGRMISHLSALNRPSRKNPLKFWGVGAMVYCNLECDRDSINIGRYLPLLGDPPRTDTGRSTMYHATEVREQVVSASLLQGRMDAMRGIWEACVSGTGAESC